MRIDVAFSIDNNYSKYCATAICSILDNKNIDDDIHFHIIHGNVEAENLEKLRCFPQTTLYKVDESEFEPFVRKTVHVGFTSMFYRLKLASLLKNIDKVIYLDCDIIVLKSLSGLYDNDISDYVLAAVPGEEKNFYTNCMKRLNITPVENGFYFNSGSLFINLQKIRDEKLEEKFFDYLKLNSQKIQFADQDTLNATLQGKCLALNSKFNFHPAWQKYGIYAKYSKDVVICHFAGIKPWGKGFYNIYEDYFWKYYKRSGFTSTEEYQKSHKIYKKSRNRYTRIFYYLKLYPLAMFHPKKISEFFKILFC